MSFPPVSSADVDAIVYRAFVLYRRRSERDAAIADLGYQVEGICCYVYADQTAGTTPLYRLLKARLG